MGQSRQGLQVTEWKTLFPHGMLQTLGWAVAKAHTGHHMDPCPCGSHQAPSGQHNQNPQLLWGIQ